MSMSATHCNTLQYTPHHAATRYDTLHCCGRNRSQPRSRHLLCDMSTREREGARVQRWRTGWRKLMGSPKLQIILNKIATEYKSLLRKMTYKDKGSYEFLPPCTAPFPLRVPVQFIYVFVCNTQQHTATHSSVSTARCSVL